MTVNYLGSSFFQAVREQESQLHGETVDAPKLLLFKDGGENLKVKLLEMKDGWQVTAEEKVTESATLSGVNKYIAFG